MCAHQLTANLLVSVSKNLSDEIWGPHQYGVAVRLMSSPQQKKSVVLDQKDIVPGDPATTLWRLCAMNGWAFVPDFAGGEPFVDLKCAAYLLGIVEKTLQNQYMDGVPEYANGLVRLSELMKRKEARNG